MSRLRQLLSDPQLKPLIFPLYVPSFIIAVAQGFIVPVLPLYLRDFDASYTMIGIVLSGNALGKLISDLPGGLILSRLGLRRTVLFGFLTFAVASVALYWTNSVASVLIYRLIGGFGMAVYSIARHSYIAERVSLSVRGRAVSTMGGIHRAGAFVGPAVGGGMALAYGLRAPFLAMGLTIGVALIVVYFAFPQDEEIRSRVIPVGSYFGGLWETARSEWRILTSVGFGQLLVQMVRQGRPAIIPLFGAEILGLTVDEIGAILSLASLVDTIFFYPAGYIMDRFGRKFAVIPSFIMQGIGLALIPFTWSYFTLAAATCLIGLGNGLSSGTMMTYGADLAPKGKRAEFLSMWQTIGSSGTSSGPVLVGAVAQVLSLTAASIVLGGAGIVAAMIFLFFVPETLKQPSAATESS